MHALGWIDLSAGHRERAKSLLDLAREPGVVDELGIGMIRDHLADAMFPGISTIQTRAKYFVLIPQLIRIWSKKSSAERRKVPLPRFMEAIETQVRIHLVENEPESSGIIGASFGRETKRSVKRRPSSVYWNGMRQFGLLQTELPAKSFYEEVALAADDSSRNGEPEGSLTTHLLDLIPHIPDSADLEMDSLSLQLSRAEANYLQGRILYSEGVSLLGWLAKNLAQVTLITEDGTETDFLHLADWVMTNKPSPKIESTVSCAREFSLLIEGAHIRYNILVAKHAEQVFAESREAMLLDLTQDWQHWCKHTLREIKDLSGSLHRLKALMGGQWPRMKPYTRTFLDHWHGQLLANPQDTDALDMLVKQQEQANKRQRARITNAAALHPSDGTQWIGQRRLNYRWNNAQQILLDLADGLEGAAE